MPETLVIKKSVAIAFYQLMQAMENGEDVLLLRSTDPFADPLVSDYEESFLETNADPAWQRFLARLAEKFHNAEQTASPKEVSDVSDAKIGQSAKILKNALSSKAVQEMLRLSVIPD